MEQFFTKAFSELQNQEELCKMLFMQSDSDEAKKVRNQYYRTVLKSMGENVKIGRNVKINHPEFISIGNNVTICDDVTLTARGEGGIEIGDNVVLNDRVYLDTESPAEGYIKIGARTYLGTGTTLFGHKGLEIGEDCLFAQNITLTPYSHIFEDPNRIIFSQGGHSKKVTIGRDVYVGMGVCILYSGDIGEGSVIGSGAVVVKPIPPYSVAVGNPARVIRKRQ